jgi:excisionase family DNA binding protein
VQHRRLTESLNRPEVSDEDFDLCSCCRKRHTWHLLPVAEACQQLGGISRSTFYELVKEGGLSLVKIGRRSFIKADELDDFVSRDRHVPPG